MAAPPRLTLRPFTLIKLVRCSGARNPALVRREAVRHPSIALPREGAVVGFLSSAVGEPSEI